MDRDNSLKGIKKRKLGLWLGLIIIIVLGLAVIEINKPKVSTLPTTTDNPSGSHNGL